MRAGRASDKEDEEVAGIEPVMNPWVSQSIENLKNDINGYLDERSSSTAGAEVELGREVASLTSEHQHFQASQMRVVRRESSTSHTTTPAAAPTFVFGSADVVEGVEGASEGNHSSVVITTRRSSAFAKTSVQLQDMLTTPPRTHRTLTNTHNTHNTHITHTTTNSPFDADRLRSRLEGDMGLTEWDTPIRHSGSEACGACPPVNELRGSSAGRASTEAAVLSAPRTPQRSLPPRKEGVVDVLRECSMEQGAHHTTTLASRHEEVSAPRVQRSRASHPSHGGPDHLRDHKQSTHRRSDLPRTSPPPSPSPPPRQPRRTGVMPASHRTLSKSTQTRLESGLASTTQSRRESIVSRRRQSAPMVGGGGGGGGSGGGATRERWSASPPGKVHAFGRTVAHSATSTTPPPSTKPSMKPRTTQTKTGRGVSIVEGTRRTRARTAAGGGMGSRRAGSAERDHIARHRNVSDDSASPRSSSKENRTKTRRSYSAGDVGGHVGGHAEEAMQYTDGHVYEVFGGTVPQGDAAGLQTLYDDDSDPGQEYVEEMERAEVAAVGDAEGDVYRDASPSLTREEVQELVLRFLSNSSQSGISEAGVVRSVQDTLLRGSVLKGKQNQSGSSIGSANPANIRGYERRRQYGKELTSENLRRMKPADPLTRIKTVRGVETCAKQVNVKQRVVPRSLFPQFSLAEEARRLTQAAVGQDWQAQATSEGSLLCPYSTSRELLLEHLRDAGARYKHMCNRRDSTSITTLDEYRALAPVDAPSFRSWQSYAKFFLTPKPFAVT